VTKHVKLILSGYYFLTSGNRTHKHIILCVTQSQISWSDQKWKTSYRATSN